MSSETEDGQQAEQAEEQLGWSVKLDHKFPYQVAPFSTPRLKHLLSILPYAPGIIRYFVKKKWAGESIPMDHANLVPYKPIYGVPLGGIGSGTIGRAYSGAFCRFQMVPGHYAHEIVEADQFILRVGKSSERTSTNPNAWQQALCLSGLEDSQQQKQPTVLPSWNRLANRDSVTYRAIYPRSWTTYDLSKQCGVKAVCRQISPVIAGDYKESCAPCAVFVWDLENTSSEDLDISLAFSFKNGNGEVAHDRRGGCYTEATLLKTEDGSRQIRCSKIFQEFRDMATTYCIGVLDGTDGDKVMTTSHKLSFNPLGDGADLWKELIQNGAFSSPLDERSNSTTQKGEEIGTAVAGSCYQVPAGQTRQIVFALAWHQPEIHFNTQGHFHKRRYVRYWSDANALVSRALSAYKQWEKAIDDWQTPVLTDNSIPAWLRSALFNELYFVADGGTVWVDVPENEIEAEALSDAHKKLVADYGRFAYLEGHEYKMFTTYDVHFNASFALVQLWPALQQIIQYEFAVATRKEDLRQFLFVMDGYGPIKVANCVPHDLGDPDHDPWLQINAYFVHVTDQWKDLNLKFILQTWRDFVYTKNRHLLEDIYPVCHDLVKRCLSLWDKDNDGLIENGGRSDQTYDIWVMTGPSAYCGGLWLGALRSCELMAHELSLKEDEQFYAETLKKASAAYENRLWNGKYYNFDCNPSQYVRDTVMADQLAGYWYLRMCDLVRTGPTSESDILPKENVDKTLDSILENNFRAINNGQWGVVNGARPNRGGVDTFCIQSEEIWTGVNYGLAALLIANGRRQEGIEVALSIYRSVYESFGLGFQTPEAYNLQFKFRSLGYMRPLAIWSIWPALKSNKSS